jgi:hypothetical protein
MYTECSGVREGRNKPNTSGAMMKRIGYYVAGRQYNKIFSLGEIPPIQSSRRLLGRWWWQYSIIYTYDRNSVPFTLTLTLISVYAEL